MANTHTGQPGCHRIREAVATITIWTMTIIVSALFCWIMFDLLRHGVQHVSWSFLFEAPRDAGRSGGIAPIIV